ncbi:YiiX/YebB-like N1pC/P60 family cysteine hydrolase [Bacillus sp. GB_SG_008]|uniref:YiiX/YebB-like N1pC/P60 family cysteine hydrolase n=1 Tax=Bacillus sp. GB_SG_008 TaxID=3454627 RepID=UPI003F86663F
MFRKISTAVVAMILAFTTFLFSDHAQAATSSTNSTQVSQDNFSEYANESASINGQQKLTKAQEQEVKQAQKELENLKVNYNEEKNKVKPDKGLDGLEISALGYGSYPRRAGTFLVTLDSGSSSGFVAGGHAGIVYDYYNTVESYGNKGSKNGVRYWPNNWNTRYSNVIGRTVSGTTASQDAYAAKWASYQIGDPYNWNFWNINQNSSFYCSQLVYRTFQYNYGKNMNYNGGAVWPVDLTKTSVAYTIYVK